MMMQEMAAMPQPHMASLPGAYGPMPGSYMHGPWHMAAPMATMPQPPGYMPHHATMMPPMGQSMLSTDNPSSYQPMMQQSLLPPLSGYRVAEIGKHEVLQPGLPHVADGDDLEGVLSDMDFKTDDF
jgi:hypothetical protein